MTDSTKLYIAGMGMITPVGANTVMTAVAVRAGISSYKISSFYGNDDKPITMASVANIVFDELNAEIGEGSWYNERHDRVIKMAILTNQEACAPCDVYLVLGTLPEPELAHSFY